MSAEVHYVEHTDGGYDQPERSDEGAERFAEQNGAEEIWYWYAYGYYCGGGVAILRGADGRWGVTTLYHCSCDGPWEDTVTWHATLADLKAREGDSDGDPLFAAIGSR